MALVCAADWRLCGHFSALRGRKVHMKGPTWWTTVGAANNSSALNAQNHEIVILFQVDSKSSLIPSACQVQ